MPGALAVPNTIGCVPFSCLFLPTMSTMGTTVPNTGGAGFGVNSSVAGDQSSSIDPGEILALTVTFDPADF